MEGTVAMRQFTKKALLDESESLIRERVDGNPHNVSRTQNAVSVSTNEKGVILEVSVERGIVRVRFDNREAGSRGLYMSVGLPLSGEYQPLSHVGAAVVHL